MTYDRHPNHIPSRPHRLSLHLPFLYTVVPVSCSRQKVPTRCRYHMATVRSFFNLVLALSCFDDALTFAAHSLATIQCSERSGMRRRIPLFHSFPIPRLPLDQDNSSQLHLFPPHSDSNSPFPPSRPLSSTFGRRRSSDGSTLAATTCQQYALVFIRSHSFLGTNKFSTFPVRPSQH